MFDQRGQRHIVHHTTASMCLAPRLILSTQRITAIMINPTPQARAANGYDMGLLHLPVLPAMCNGYDYTCQYSTSPPGRYWSFRHSAASALMLALHTQSTQGDSMSTAPPPRHAGEGESALGTSTGRLGTYYWAFGR